MTLYLFHRSTKKGFTLVEIMIVTAVIAILTAMILASLVGSKAKSRDARRVSDLSQILYALGQYFDKCDQYPTPDTGNVIDANTLLQSTGCPSGVTFGSFLSAVPKDPNTGSPYNYVVNNSPASDYVLYTTFETSNTAVSQSAPNPSWFSSFACTTGRDYCVRPD